MENDFDLYEAVRGRLYLLPDEYLMMDRSSAQRLEYYNGRIKAAYEACLLHSQVVANLISSIGPSLRKQGCQVLPSNMRVATPRRDAYFYPDALIVCGAPLMETGHFDTLYNPSVVFELLSFSTSRNEPGHKLRWYRTIPSLEQYILFDSEQRFARVLQRVGDGRWLSQDHFHSNTLINLRAIDRKLSFDEVYAGTGI